jgi:pimeloyl-ACP methyl ester carboxylesterase
MVGVRKARNWLGAMMAAMAVSGCATLPAPPAPGQPPIYADCRGAPSASPTVILESGAFGTSADWDLVLDDLAKGGRACAYDRSGLGRSAPTAEKKDVVSIAHELAQVLDTLGETRPVILVGHSNGALYAETFAALWPQRVAGLVYVNGVGSADLDYPLLVDDLTKERHLSNLAGVLADAGLAPVVSGLLTGHMDLPDAAADRKRSSLDTRDEVITARNEDREIVPGLTVVRGLGGSPPSVPTVVIVSVDVPGSPLTRAWREAEIVPARRAKASWVLEAPGANHTSPLVRDRAYVVAGVDWLRSLPIAAPLASADAAHDAAALLSAPASAPSRPPAP